MFGGVCFTLRGHMCCGVVGDELVVRVGPAAYAAALARPHARAMDFTGRPLKGYVFVARAGHRSDRDLGAWLRRAVELVESLPAKKRTARRGRGEGQARQRVKRLKAPR